MSLKCLIPLGMKQLRLRELLQKNSTFQGVKRSYASIPRCGILLYKQMLISSLGRLLYISSVDATSKSSVCPNAWYREPAIILKRGRNFEIFCLSKCMVQRTSYYFKGRELSERHLVILCRHEGSFLHEMPSWEQLELRAVPNTEKVINKCLVFTNMNSRGVGHYEVRCIKMFLMDSSHWVLSSENEKTEVFSPRTFFVEVIVRSSHKALVPGKVRCALHDDISGASCVCFKFQIMGTWRMKN
ncbi:uncharacterized protein RBU33_000983 [Hipposideros larvatus]